MALKENEALELLKFLNLSDAETVEEAKEKFTAAWIKSEELSSKIIRRLRTLSVEHQRKQRKPTKHRRQNGRAEHQGMVLRLLSKSGRRNTQPLKRSRQNLTERGRMLSLNSTSTRRR
jgi:hypothetical protein